MGISTMNGTAMSVAIHTNAGEYFGVSTPANVCVLKGAYENYNIVVLGFSSDVSCTKIFSARPQLS